MTTADKTPEPHGVLVVDKAVGPTSHDVVAVARRVLGTKAIGHTGTLDPMATGVLVLAVGEATKLVNLLGASEKTYRATLALGVTTDSLDADGEVTERCDVPALDLAAVRAVATRFVGEIDQEVPKVSAVKQGGRSLHELARKGREIVAPVRRVHVHALELEALRDGTNIDFVVTSSKGFYVRSLARDLAQALGTVGHLTALRRTHNGAFTLQNAVDFELLRAAGRGTPEQRTAIREQLVPFVSVCRSLPGVVLDESGTQHARHGRAIPATSVTTTDALEDEAVRIAFDAAGEPLAIVQLSGSVWRVLRGFRGSG